MGNLISITNLEYHLSNLGTFGISFAEALYDYESDEYSAVQIVINKGVSSDHDAVYLHQLVTLWGLTPVYKDGETWISLEELDKALLEQEAEILVALKQSWGPYWWEETDVPPHCLIIDHRGGHWDAPRYRSYYRKDAMTKV